MIRDECTLASSGFRCAGTPEELLAALGSRYETEGRPKGLTLLFSSAQGDNDGKGLDHLAKGDLLRRSIGGFYGVTPGLVERIQSGRVAGYNLPQGVMVRLYQAIATGQPGVITRVGLCTYVDPRFGGGRLNSAAKESLNEIINLRGEDYILYHGLPIDVCFIRATTADPHGNLSCEREAIKLEWMPLATATRNSGGLVVAQVEKLSSTPMHPRNVEVPAHLVDVVVLATDPDSGHRQCVRHVYNPAYAGDAANDTPGSERAFTISQQLIARRAAGYVQPGDIINLGSGMPEAVGEILRKNGLSGKVHSTLESGVNGGSPAAAPDFGLASCPDSIVRQDDQFSLYQGGGLDCGFLGFAEIDEEGNVNVSRFGGRIVGCGGFIDIAQNAKRVVFCGTLNSKGLDLKLDGNRLSILREGLIPKFVRKVEQVTYCGREGLRRKQEIFAVTERCVLQFTDEGWGVTETAPGVDLSASVLSQMQFAPNIHRLAV